MDRSDLIQRLHQIEPQLRAHGVAALFLFGSRARGEARPGSDVDLFADAEPERFGLDRYAEAYGLIEAALPDMEVAFSTRGAIAPAYLETIENEAIRIF